MKKRLTLFLALIVSIFALVACSSQTQGEKAKGTEQPKELTAWEVLTKANETMTSVKGYKIEGSGKQWVDWSDKPKVKQKLTIKCKVSNHPAVAHSEMTIKMDGMKLKTEMYSDQQNVYISDFMTKQWVKLPARVPGMDQNDPMAELKNVKSLLEQLSKEKDKALQMKKENGQYIVTLNIAAIANKKEVRDFIGKISQAMGGSNQLYVDTVKELVSNMKIEKMKYVYYIDEKTFEVKKQESELKMEMSMDQKKVVTDQKLSYIITKSDEVVTIPEEVKQKAQAQY